MNFIYKVKSFSMLAWSYNYEEFTFLGSSSLLPPVGQKTVIGVIVCTSGKRSLWLCLLSSVRMSSSVVVNCCCGSGCRLGKCDLMWSLIMAEICCCSLAKFWIWCQHWEMQVWIFCILLSVVWWMSCVGPGLYYLYPLRESTDWCLGEWPFFSYLVF